MPLVNSRSVLRVRAGRSDCNQHQCRPYSALKMITQETNRCMLTPTTGRGETADRMLMPTGAAPTRARYYGRRDRANLQHRSPLGCWAPIDGFTDTDCINRHCVLLIITTER
jgi:hypothetical protein